VPVVTLERWSSPHPPVRVGRLDTVTRVRRECARLYKDARTGRVDPSDASKLVGLLQLLVRTIETSDLEARLERLERGGGEEPAEGGAS